MSSFVCHSVLLYTEFVCGFSWFLQLGKDGRRMAGVNVQSGRSGWFKRINRIATKVTKSTELVDCDATGVGLEFADAAAHTAHKFAKKSMTDARASMSIADVYDEPKCRSYQPQRLTPCAIQDSAGSKAGTTNPVLLVDAGHAVDVVAKDVSDDSDSDFVPSVPFLTFMGAASTSPKKSATKAAAGKSAATNAKPAGKPKTRATGAKPSGNPGSAPKKSGTTPTKRPSDLAFESSSPKVCSGNMDDGDEQLLQHFNDQLLNMRKTIMKDVPSADSQLNEAMRCAVKHISAVMASIRAKLKSLTRRKEIPLVKDDLESMLTELDEISSICKDLQGGNSATDDDNLLALIQSHSTNWEMAQSIHKRALKCMCLLDLRWSRWADFCTTSKIRIETTLGESDGIRYWNMMLNEIFQKLLRAMPIQKATRLECCSTCLSDIFVSCHVLFSAASYCVVFERSIHIEHLCISLQVTIGSDALDQLKSLVAQLSSVKFITGELACTIDHIRAILEPSKFLPATVSAACDSLDSASLQAIDDDSGLAAIFGNIPQGKQLIKVVRLHAEKKMKELGCLQGLTTTMEKLQQTRNTCERHELQATLVEAIDNLRNAIPKAGSETTKQYCEDSKDLLQNILQQLVTSHVDEDLCPWVKQSCADYLASGAIPVLPEWSFCNLSRVVDTKACHQLALGHLPVVLEIHSVLVTFAATIKKAMSFKHATVDNTPC